jgi:fermentation-respiration switch protein FrsA (DUF1100 family)
MQGGEDPFVPTDSGNKLYEAAGEPKEFWYDPTVGHNGFDRARAEEFERRVAAFFDQYLLGK